MGNLSTRRGANRQLLSNSKLSATRGHLGQQSSCDAQPFLENGGNRPLLPEHSRIKMKRHGSAEFDFSEIWVSRVQEDIPFAADCRRRDQQSYRVTGAYPFISEATQRFLSLFVPVGWQSLLVESRNSKLFGNLAFD